MKRTILSSLATATSFLCALAAAPARLKPTTSPTSPPKVRVAPNGAGFQTDSSSVFVPFGVNYYRPGTGWAPQLWKTFDPQATRRDFALLRSLGGNCVRVFLTFGSFYNQPGVLSDEGLAKFDQFLALAEEAGIYVHPTGPDSWEGHPQWVGADRFADERVLVATESFWKAFAARYKGRSVVFAYDLLNEPMIPWKTPAMVARWDKWVRSHYTSAQSAANAWGLAPQTRPSDSFPVPAVADKPADPMLLDYQRFREDIADEWTRRQVAAIKSADPDALVTVGFIQWSVPALLPGIDRYAAFRPDRQARFLDFLEIHFYPLDKGSLEYGDPDREQRNLAYLEAVVSQVARPGKPVVVAEFGWYGGGSIPMGKRLSKPGTQQDQARWCDSLIQTTAPLASGWLNWGFYDHPQAKDVSVLTGLLTADGKEKAWAVRFRQLSRHYQDHPPASAPLPPRPPLPWDRCITSTKAAEQFRDEYYKAFLAAPSTKMQDGR